MTDRSRTPSPSEPCDSLPTRPDETPQARLLRAGARVLNDAELGAVLLGSTPQRAAALLATSGPCISRLLESGPAALGSFSRSGQAHLLAAFELARRLARAAVPDREALRCPDALARYLALRYRSLDQEIVGVLSSIPDSA
jgi:DNA repair protein RadC